MKPFAITLLVATLALSAFGQNVPTLEKTQKAVQSDRTSGYDASMISTMARAIVDKNGAIVFRADPAGTNLIFGTEASAFKTTLVVTPATANRSITVTNVTGTVCMAQASTTAALTADNQAVTPGKNTVIQLTSDNATDTNRTFTLSATGAVTGQIYVIVGPATNGCEIADTGIQKLSATWSPTTSDTLTLLFDGTNFIELARSNN